MADWLQSALNGVGNFWNSISGANSQNQFNAGQAQIERDWQEYMRGSNYQAVVDDMKKAGLNPAMFYQSGGAGIDTPSAPAARASQGSGILALGQLAQVVNSVTNARALDARTHQNEISGKTASNIYKETAKIASMLAKFIS